MFLFILEREREKRIIMSQCVVPNWNLRHQRQEQVEAEEGNRSSHVLNSSSLVPMSNYEVAELTWANGQLAMHGLSGLLPSAPTKPTWGRAGDTLESIVHQATCQKHDLNTIHHNHNPANISSIPASSGGKWAESSAQVPMIAPKLVRKRMRSDSDQCGRNLSTSVREERTDRTSACASASATFCRDNDTTMMTWASFESPRSLKTKTTDEDSACDHHGGGSENRDDHEERETKGETGRSHTTRRIRAAAIHNQSERRRRDRINQKMKALQKLVPNASKTDKASMLDEVIEYLKQLQAQVQMMNSVRNMPQMNMMMPLGMQQQHHLQMSLLARMGMGVGLGMGMGMLDMSSIARASPQSLSHPLLQPTTVAAAAPTFVPPPFVVAPPMMPPHTPVAQPSSDHGSTNASVPLHDPYYAFLAQQSMNIDLYNKMAVLYRQQVNRTTQATSSPSRSNHVQGD